MAETHYIADILILLTAAIVAVLLFQRLGLGTVLARPGLRPFQLDYPWLLPHDQSLPPVGGDARR